MPFELTTPGAVMFARVFGVFTAGELDHLTDEAEIAEASHPVSLDRITDLTAVDRFDLGFREIYFFAMRRSTQRFSRVVKSAIIVRDPVQFGIARNYEALNENPQIEVRTLRAVTEATEWFAEMRRSTQRFSRVVKSAIIVRDPVQFGIARNYEALNENPQIEVRTLRAVTEATEWFAESTAG